ncbi:MAG: hypothetical protein N2318_05675, partial [Meiothermus sp.]|nr:hypothetical protein [Meiothermus sp.]
LQSPFGALGLRQHTPLIAVPQEVLQGGIYEKTGLSTGGLWITGQKIAVFSIKACKPAFLDFLCRRFVLLIKNLGFQGSLLETPTTSL